TKQMLLDLGVPAESIKSESFTSPARAALVSGGVVSGGVVSNGVVSGGLNDATTHHSPLTTHHSPPATLTFARSGKSLPISARQTVLEAAEDLGVSINYDCRSGICGQCKIKILAGHVTMEP